MTASHQNVNAPAQLSPAHFLWIRAFSHAPLNGGGVTALNRVPVFALQSKVICLPRCCPLFNFLPTENRPRSSEEKRSESRSYFRKSPDPLEERKSLDFQVKLYVELPYGIFSETVSFDVEGEGDIWFWCVLRQPSPQFLCADFGWF